MENIFFFAILWLITCQNPVATPSVSANPLTVSKEEALPPALSKKDSLLQHLKKQYADDYDGYTNAVRNLVLQQMDESILKNSCLEEFYLQELAKTTNDSIVVTLPFDLHGYDCGAPDCYTTKVRFSLPNKIPIVFPEKLPFYEEETGCIDEYHFKDTYELIEATPKHVIYHCNKRKRTLVLFFPKEKGSWRGSANYFVGVGRKRFNGKNIYTVYEDYREDKPKSQWNIMPYTLTSFNRVEYEFMLKD